MYLAKLHCMIKSLRSSQSFQTYIKMYKTDTKDSLIEMYHYRVEALQNKIEFLEAQLEVNQMNEVV